VVTKFCFHKFNLYRYIKELNDKGGVPSTVGQGLLNAFVNLEDNKGKKKRREIDSDDSDDE
jgi:hypothetical protein